MQDRNLEHLKDLRTCRGWEILVLNYREQFRGQLEAKLRSSLSVNDLASARYAQGIMEALDGIFLNGETLDRWTESIITPQEAP